MMQPPMPPGTLGGYPGQPGMPPAMPPQGFPPGYPAPPAPMPPAFPTPPVLPPPPPNEPPPKRQKVENGLQPAEEWIASHSEPILIKIAIPEYENKNNWNLEGQTLEFRMNVSEKVSVLKAKLSEALNGMPANKQNLKVEGLPFLKDKDTLAQYNLEDNVEINLGVKERGRRKK